MSASDNIPVMSNESVANIPMTMEQLRVQDSGPDLSKGKLISEVWDTEEDGTPYVERVYEKDDAVNGVKGARAKATSGKVTRTKNRNYGAAGSVEVTARFYWNSPYFYHS